MVPATSAPGENQARQAQGLDIGEPVGVIDELFAVGDHRIHHRMPTATQILGDLTDRAAMAAHLEGDPPPGPIGDRQPRANGDLRPAR